MLPLLLAGPLLKKGLPLLKKLGKSPLAKKLAGKVFKGRAARRAKGKADAGTTESEFYANNPVATSVLSGDTPAVASITGKNIPEVINDVLTRSTKGVREVSLSNNSLYVAAALLTGVVLVAAVSMRK